MHVIAHRASIAAEYMTRLSAIPGIAVQQVRDGNLSTRLYMAMIVDREAFGLNADELVEALRAENIVGRRFLIRRCTGCPITAAASATSRSR